MISKYSIGLFMALLVCSCAHKSGHGERKSDKKVIGLNNKIGRMIFLLKELSVKETGWKGRRYFENTTQLFLWFLHLTEEILIKGPAFL